MKAKNSLRILPGIALFAVCLLLPMLTHAQCATDVNLGQNLVVNGDFSNGYSNWTFDAPYKIKGGGNSNPTDLQVGTNPATFNTGGGGFPPFDTYGDHTTGSGNFLIVDGYCSASSTVKVWSQTVNVIANTNYYFSVWISSLKDMPTNSGNLNFNIGGSDLGSNILAPRFGGATASNGTNTGGGWIRYVIVWNSGATAGPVALSIQNNNTSACGSEVDFGLDDIAFTPGCDFGVPGPQPDLGPDRSLCGSGGSITLNANVPMNATTTVSWSSNSPGVLTGTGLGAPYTKTFTAPGTYSVCVTDNGSCTKSDVIVITNTFTPNTSPGANLCSTTSVLLDAVFTGIGVTYQWKRGGVNLPNPSTNRTYTATTAGNYTVDVTVPGCGTVSSGISAITTSSTITPVDAYYCATSGPVSGLTLGATIASPRGPNLRWYTTATGGTPIASGVTSTSTSSTYTLPTIPATTTATQTYYVEDNTPTAGVAGAPTYSSSGINSINGWTQPFNIVGEVTVNSLQIPFITYFSPAGGFAPPTVTLEVVTATGASFPTPIILSSTATTGVPGNDGGNTRLYTFPFTTFVLSQALQGTTSFRLKLNSFTHGNGAVMVNQSGFTYPIVSTPDAAVTITGANTNNAASPSTDSDGYAYFYNWQVSSKYPCSRTPVRAISNCVTPVTWTSFYLVPQNNACKLVWSTADETNNSYFAIERSIDGITFETIGTVSGAGNRDIASNYFYVDHAPVSGTSYYRITQYDYDGTFSSTAMRPYSSEGLVKVTTYPNPFQNNTTLLVSGADAETYTYALYTVSGQLVEQGLGTINQTQTIGESAAKGMYLLTVLTSTESVTAKIVKQ